MAISLAAALGAVLGFREGVVRYRAPLLIGDVGMLAAPAGIWLAHRTPPAVLAMGLVVVMALSALAMYRRSLGLPTRADTVSAAAPPCCWSAETGRFVWMRSCGAVLAAIGFVTGALSGLLGMGGGFLLVPALTRLSNLRVNAIVSTSQAVIALVSAAGAVAAMGALVGARRLARRLPPQLIQRSFALLSGGIAIVLLSRAAQGA